MPFQVETIATQEDAEEGVCSLRMNDALNLHTGGAAALSQLTEEQQNAEAVRLSIADKEDTIERLVQDWWLLADDAGLLAIGVRVPHCPEPMLHQPIWSQSCGGLHASAVTTSYWVARSAPCTCWFDVSSGNMRTALLRRRSFTRAPRPAGIGLSGHSCVAPNRQCDHQGQLTQMAAALLLCFSPPRRAVAGLTIRSAVPMHASIAPPWAGPPRGGRSRGHCKWCSCRMSDVCRSG